MNGTVWVLAIDFGTTATSAAVLTHGRSEVLEVDGVRRLPSIVMWADGELICGQAAAAQLLWRPEAAERTPKRFLGTRRSLLLDGEPVPVVTAVATVLHAVYTEALRRFDGQPPAHVWLTHPVRWDDTRVAALRQAADAAGIPEVSLIAEPIAAALHYGGGSIAVGQYVGVYDLGGGTFDTAILRRTRSGFELAGPPGGDERLGGEDFDHRLMDFVIAGLSTVEPDVAVALRESTDSEWLVTAAQLLEQCRLAKEALSRQTTYTMVIPPPVRRQIRITRPEFEALIRGDVQRTVEEFLATIDRAGLQPKQLSARYLTGGASRIPLVSRLMHEALHQAPNTYDDPKTAVALGATLADTLTDVSATESEAPTAAARDEPLAASLDEPPIGSPTDNAPSTARETVALPPDEEPSASHTPPPPDTTGANSRPRLRRRGVVLAAVVAIVVVIATAGVVLLVRDNPQEPDQGSAGADQPNLAAQEPVRASESPDQAAVSPGGPIPAGGALAWKAWGVGFPGELLPAGTGAVPAEASDLTGVIAIAPASNSGGAYALHPDGTVMDWGVSDNVQSNNDAATDLAPVDVSGLTDVTAIAAGYLCGYALLADGSVMAWGGGERGQLGNGNTDYDSAQPIQVTGLAGVTAIAAGGRTGYALLEDGTVMAWGHGESGRLGNGATTDSAVPVSVSGLVGVTAIAADGLGGYALLEDGTVMAWGSGESGRLGNGATTDSAVPVSVSGLVGVTAIAARGLGGYALLGNGGVMAWGGGESGRLGNGATTDSAVPVSVSGLVGVTAIAAGAVTGYALLEDGTVKAWGGGLWGQLGNDGTTDSAVPVAVSGLTGVTAIAAGDWSGFARG